MTVTTKYFSVWKQDKDMGPRGFPGPGGADGAPGEGVEYPGAGIPVSTGTAWGSSLGIANNTDNYLVTMTGTGFNGEANLTFNGTTLNVNGLSIINNTIDAQDGHNKHLTITAGDALSSGNYGGNLYLKAGSAIWGDSSTLRGDVYLIPGTYYNASYIGYIYIGTDDTAIANYYISAKSSSASANITIQPKGGGWATLGSSSGYATVAGINLTLQSNDITIGYANNCVITGATGSTTGKNITIKPGGGQPSYGGGNLYLYGGDPGSGGTRGNVYFGNGSTAYLPARDAETNNIFYDTTTGKLSYGTLTAALVGAIADPGTSVDREILTWNGTTGDAVRVSVGVKIDTNKSVLAEGDVIAYYA